MAGRRGGKETTIGRERGPAASGSTQRHEREASNQSHQSHQSHTISELIREEFGDGIMSAINFELKFERVPDPKGDRVKLTLDGKFLPYRVW